MNYLIVKQDYATFGEASMATRDILYGTVNAKTCLTIAQTCEE